MRIVSFNANGIRSAADKGFFDWMAQRKPDVVCVQETKARIEQLEGKAAFFPEGYHCYYEDATRRKGYSGVALYCRREPDEIIRGFGQGFEEFDAEGRYIEARFGDLAVASIYVLSGTSGEERQAAKFRFMDLYMPRLQAQADDGLSRIICGDWNIAHKQIDLKNWRSNRRTPASYPKNGPGWINCTARPAGWTPSGSWTHAKGVTHGGPIGAGLGQTTWDGGSTTKSSRRICGTRCRRRISTERKSSPIRRR